MNTPITAYMAPMIIVAIYCNLLIPELFKVNRLKITIRVGHGTIPIGDTNNIARELVWTNSGYHTPINKNIKATKIVTLFQAEITT